MCKFSDIVQKVIPFFEKYQIEGVKAEDFADFCRAAELMKSKKHNTKEGIEEINTLKERMNRGRLSTNLDYIGEGCSKLLGKKKMWV